MNKWIKVTEKLPELMQVVLVFHHPYIGIEQRTDPKDGNIWASTEKKYITHWMPLPEHPKNEEIQQLNWKSLCEEQKEIAEEYKKLYLKTKELLIEANHIIGSMVS